MFNFLRSLISEIRKWFHLKPSPYRAINCEDLPDKLEERVLYILGRAPYEWSLGMRCPCGCKATIQLNLLKQASPCWELQRHKDGKISVFPSVWRTAGCESHFFLEHNQIRWCPNRVS